MLVIINSHISWAQTKHICGPDLTLGLPDCTLSSQRQVPLWEMRTNERASEGRSRWGGAYQHVTLRTHRKHLPNGDCYPGRAGRAWARALHLLILLKRGPQDGSGTDPRSARGRLDPDPGASLKGQPLPVRPGLPQTTLQLSPTTVTGSSPKGSVVYAPVSYTELSLTPGR